MRPARSVVAGGQLGRARHALDRVADLDPVVVQRQRQRANRRPYDAGGQGLRILGLQPGIAPHRRQDGVAQLPEACRHTGGLAVLRHHGRGGQGAPAAAGIGGREVALGHAAVQLGDVRHAEGRGHIGAQLQAGHHLPVQAHLVGALAAEQAVVGIACGGVEGQRLDQRLALQQRHRQLGEDLTRGVLAGDRVLPIGVGRTDDGQVVRITPAALLADLQARGKSHRAGGQLEQLAADAGAHALLIITAGVARRGQDVAQHFGREIAVAQVVAAGNGGVGGRAAARAVQRLFDAVQVRDLGGAIRTRVAAPVQRHGPVPVLAQTALGASHRAEDIGLLEEVPHARLLEATPLKHQGLAGRVRRMIRRNVDRAVNPQGPRRGQLARLAAREQQFGEELGPVAQVQRAEGAEAQALDRIHGIQVRIAVVVVLGRGVGLVEAGRRVQGLTEVDASAVGQARSTADRCRTAGAHQLAVGFAQATRRAAGHVHIPALRIVDRRHQRALGAGDAPGQVDGRLVPVAA